MKAIRINERNDQAMDLGFYDSCSYELKVPEGRKKAPMVVSERREEISINELLNTGVTFSVINL